MDTVQMNTVETAEATAAAVAAPVAAASAEITPVSLEKPIFWETPGIRLEVTEIEMLGEALVPNGKKAKPLSVVFFEIEGYSNCDRYLEGCGTHGQFWMWRQLLPDIFRALGLSPETPCALNGYPDRVNQRPGYVLEDDINLQVFVNCKLTFGKDIAAPVPKAPRARKVSAPTAAPSPKGGAAPAPDTRKWPWEIEDELKVGGDDLEAEQPVSEEAAHMTAIAGEEESQLPEEQMDDDPEYDIDSVEDEEPSDDELDDIEDEEEADEAE